MMWLARLMQLSEQESERYLPTAFNSGLTLLDKINKVIEYLNQTIEAVNTIGEYVDENVTDQNNKVKQLREDFEVLKEWLENEGLEERTSQVLNEWFDSGKLAEIINGDVLGMKINKGEVTVSDIDKNFGLFDQTFLSPQLIAQITGTADINATVAEGSLTLKQTAFAKESKNIFNKETAVYGAVSDTTGVIIDSTSFMSTLQYTKVTPQSTLNFSGNIQTIVFYDYNKVFISSITADSSGLKSVLIPDGVSYVRYSIYHTAVPLFMVSVGSLPLQYEPYSIVIPLKYLEKPKPITIEDIAISRVISKNQFNKQTAIKGSMGNDGNIYPNQNYYISDYVKVVPNQMVFFKGSKIEGYFLYDENKLKLTANAGELISELLIPNNVYYMRVMFWHTNYDKFSIVFNEDFNDYDSYKYGLPKEYLETDTSGLIKNKYEIEESFGVYNRTDVDYLNSWTLTSLDAYLILDKIVEDFPNWCSKIQYGISSDGKPIYKYSFKPEMVLKERVEQSLPLFVVTNTHSFEKPALAGTVQFFKDLAYNWKSNNELRIIRWNVHFEVIPVVNPYGVDNRSRTNANGVDINRNFSAGWNTDGENGVIGSDYYSGVTSMTEPETLILDKLMNEFKHADYAIDIHNYTTLEVSSPTSVLWVGSNVAETRSKLVSYTQQTSTIAQAKYISDNILGYENKTLGLVETNSLYGGATVWQWESYNVQTTLLELVSDFGTNQQDIQTFTVEAIGNLILNGLRKFI